ncbi:MAG: hypothetical protein FD170_3646 [Bacteroidetes bacterium]|nr:MAG: hypothetical protein FD170_3646 [Bacteroidota bacterium]
MVNRKNTIQAVVALLLLVIVASCSAPAYKQNKYKSGKRFRDCGCYKHDASSKSVLSYNEQK